MYEDNDHFTAMDGHPANALSIAKVASYPVWKRTVAVVWVIVLCGLAGGLGLGVASLFTFSGY